MKRFADHNITVFGDSIPRGIVLKENKISQIKNGVVDLVSKKLEVSIENLSSFGQSLKRLCEKDIFGKYIESIKSKKEKFNVAVIAVGGNDCDFDWNKVAENPTFEHEPLTSITTFENLLDSTVKKLQEQNVHVVVFTIPPIDSKKYFENVISKRANASKVLEFFCGDISNISRTQESYNLAIIKCAMKNKCNLIDIRTRLLLNRNYLNLMCEDGVHPNEKGHQVMCDEILNTLENII